MFVLIVRKASLSKSKSVRDVKWKLYCSRKCQVVDCPEHKEGCKKIQALVKDELSTAECVD
jgi:hypothetical protein